MPTVSIIIPVYNKDNYIDKTLQSVLNQTFSDFEAILVDDGSTDGSGEILRQYAALDHRIHLISTSNGGVSRARNIGLQNASGNWLQFLDGDDMIDPEYLSAAVEIAAREKADILFTDFCMKDEDGRIVKVISSGKNGSADTRQLCMDFMELQYSNGFFGFISNKLFQKSLLMKTGAAFDPAMKLAEDLDFYTRLYSRAEKVWYLPVNSFTYLQTEENYQHNVEIDYHAQLKVRLHICRWMKQCGCYEQHRDKLDRDVANYAYYCLFDGNEHGRSITDETEKLIRQEEVIGSVRSSLQKNTFRGFQKQILTLLTEGKSAGIQRLFILRNAARGIYRMVKR